MKSAKIAVILAVFFAATTVAFAQSNLTQQQKQIPENKGTIVIEVPEQKKNVNISPDSIQPGKADPEMEKKEPNIIIKTKSLDNDPTFPERPKLNYEGKYYIPAEGTAEWIMEDLKNRNEGIRWDNGWDDLTINRPGDTWGDITKVFNFQFATTVSTLGFLYFYKVDGLVLEDRAKSFFITSVFMALLELVDATSPKNHFCTKDFGAGLAGALCGSLVITIGFGF